MRRAVFSSIALVLLGAALPGAMAAGSGTVLTLNLIPVAGAKINVLRILDAAGKTIQTYPVQVVEGQTAALMVH